MFVQYLQVNGLRRGIEGCILTTRQSYCLQVLCVSSCRHLNHNNEKTNCDIGLHRNLENFVVKKVSWIEVRCKELGENCIQIFHLGRYIVRYTVGNFV